MKIRSFEFSLQELAGSMGDFGTLFPLAIGYIVVCNLNPAGFLVMMGLANIVTGLIYKLPMPIEPMKVLAVVAIAQHWSPSLVYASGFAMGLVWLFLGLTGIMTWLGRIVPAAVVRGVQVTLGLMLAIEALKMIRAGWWLGLVAIVIVIALRRNRYAPAALVLMGLGLLIMLARGQMRSIPTPAWQLPVMTGFRLGELWPAMMLAGFAQIPLTATNAVISTASLIKKYWPERAVTERQLALNQGVMNLILPFFGGMPLCHGAGGLVGQYYFGARTGGTNILEGLIEITLGLVLANSIKGLFGFFPRPIIGAMMFLVGLELVKFSKDIFVLSGLGAIPPACSWRYIRQIGINRHLMAMALTILVSLTSNMAVGFTAGCLLYALLSFFFEAPATLSTWP